MVRWHKCITSILKSHTLIAQIQGFSQYQYCSERAAGLSKSGTGNALTSRGEFVCERTCTEMRLRTEMIRFTRKAKRGGFHESKTVEFSSSQCFLHNINDCTDLLVLLDVSSKDRIQFPIRFKNSACFFSS